MSGPAASEAEVQTGDEQEQQPPSRGPRLEPPDLPGFRLDAHERLPIRRVSIASLVSAPIWAIVFGLAGYQLAVADEFAIRITITGILGMLAVVLLLVPILHEAVHGIAALLAGARPFFGIGEGFAYTSFREPVSRNAYLAIIVAPLVILSAASLTLIALFPAVLWFAVGFAFVNASGSAGDLWMLGKVSRLPSTARIVDLADGYAVYVPSRS